METNVLIEPIGANRYRATGSAPFALSMEGTTRAEAIANFQKAAAALLSPNAELIRVDVPTVQPLMPPDDPWAWYAGIAKNDPPEWRAAYEAQIEENRRIDEENVNRWLAEEEAREETDWLPKGDGIK